MKDTSRQGGQQPGVLCKARRGAPLLAVLSDLVPSQRGPGLLLLPLNTAPRLELSLVVTQKDEPPAPGLHHRPHGDRLSVPGNHRPVTRKIFSLHFD